MTGLLADVTVAMRALRKHPGFSAGAILTLAVALGATSAMLSAFDRLVLEPVSMPDPGSLVAIWFNSPQRNVQAYATSIPRYEELAARTHAFASIALSGGDNFTLTGDRDPLQLNGLRVTASFFPTLGILPARGRNFLPSEDVPNGPAVCIISHELWQTRFGGREDVLNNTIQLDGRAWEVVGIMPAGLTAPFGQVQVFTPRVGDVSFLTPAQIQNGATYFQPIARLRPGVTLAQAAAELAAFSKGYHDRYPARLDANNITYPRQFVEQLVSGVAPSMYTLIGAVGCVLLIACANIASLFLNRLMSRRKDIAVRLSLGASRGAIVRQFLIESLIFSGIATVIGTLFARWSLTALSSAVNSQLPPNTTLTMNWRVLGATALIALAAACLTGLVPAVQASRPEVVEHLKDGARGSSTGQGGRLRQMLVVSEVMLSVMLLVGAALLLASFVRLQQSSLGFDTRGVASAVVGLAPGRYPAPAQQAAFYEHVIERLEADPNVTAAAALGAPLLGATRMPYAVAGRPVPPLNERPITNANVVSHDFFTLLTAPIVEGRGFTADDRATAPPVCIINQTLAAHLFNGSRALEQSILIGRDANISLRIVGVIRDMKSAGANNATPDEIYMPLEQRPNPSLLILARTTGDAAALQAAIRGAVTSVDRNQAISFFATMDTTLAQAVGAQRLVATLTSVFAGLAVALALTGLYSVIAYGVSQRTSEIGIRMALGASRRHVVTMVMQGGLRLVGVGVAAGLVGAVIAARLIRQLLFGIRPVNPLVYAAVAALFLIVAALACLAPSLRASRIDPLIAVKG